MSIKGSDEENFLKHRLRLFLSVDMVGSTAFKQGQEALGASDEDKIPGLRWFSASTLFYSQIAYAFSKEWEKIKRITKANSDLTGEHPPRFWKAAGDEILYFKELTDHRQALLCLYAWRKAVNASRKVFMKDF